ncbi:MAG: carbohydrate kinase family protein [bacterium]|nr:carbohydrate kinase family protein [bacterium]MDZ4299744.1 carbohydrate kinase family protein [Candidatus Sungbacteria bacterium]
MLDESVLMSPLDFLAIGDTVTDAFIRLKEASVRCDAQREKCEICMRFGDKIPYEDVFVIPAVGNSANAAVSAARLGLSSALVSNVGDDYYGKECLDALAMERVGTEFVVAHMGRKTNYHYVLWYEDDRTILIKHEEYDYALPDIGSPKWLYLSSLGENSAAFHSELEKYLSAHTEIKLAFQPGTFQMKMGRTALAGIYARADVFFCNKEEAQRILEIEESDIKKLLAAMRELGPKIVVITDGTKGAYAYDGNEMVFMRAYPDPKPPYERTGAGDAFSSTFTAALAIGMNVREALRWGPINSMSVVQQVGARAGLLTRPELEKLLAAAPEDYMPQKI